MQVNCSLAPYSVCKPISVCAADGQFTAQSATITSNALCLNFTECATAFGKWLVGVLALVA